MSEQYGLILNILHILFGFSSVGSYAASVFRPLLISFG